MLTEKNISSASMDKICFTGSFLLQHTKIWSYFLAFKFKWSYTILWYDFNLKVVGYYN